MDECLIYKKLNKKKVELLGIKEVKLNICNIASILTDSKYTKDVCFGNCELDDKEMYYIADIIKFNKSINKINLLNNQIGNDGVKLIAEGLKENKEITKFYLGKRINSVKKELNIFLRRWKKIIA